MHSFLGFKKYSRSSEIYLIEIWENSELFGTISEPKSDQKVSGFGYGHGVGPGKAPEFIGSSYITREPIPIVFLNWGHLGDFLGPKSTPNQQGPSIITIEPTRTDRPSPGVVKARNGVSITQNVPTVCFLSSR